MKKLTVLCIALCLAISFNAAYARGGMGSRMSTMGGALGTSGSLDFLFERKGVFKLPAEGVNLEELELDLIDYGAEEITVEDGEVFIYTQYSDFGSMQKALEERGLNVTSAGLERIPNSTTELPPEAEEELSKLLLPAGPVDDAGR